MYEILLSLCLAGAPADCRVERHPGGETRAACMDRADALADMLAAEATDRPQAWPCVKAGEPPDVAFTRIAEGVFVRKGVHDEAAASNRGGIANIGLVVGEDAAALIDAGGSPADARALVAAARAVTDRPIEWVILTHMHPDHTLGAGVLADLGARVVGHPRLARAFAARRDTYLEAYARLLGPNFDAAEIDFAIEEAPAVIDLGGRSLELSTHATAHTDNDLMVFDRRNGVLLMGDLLFVDHMPAVDGSIRGWLAIKDALASHFEGRAPTALVPGHGPVKVDWPDAFAPQEAYLNGLSDGAKRALDTGETLLDLLDAPPPPEGGEWLLEEAFHLRNLSSAYKEFEWD